jgi:hypothetical protein
MAMRIPAIPPAKGTVKIQLATSKKTRCQLTALRVPLHRPTPTVAPVIHIDVETGRENWEKRRTVIAAPISMLLPRLGEWYVILLPMTVEEGEEWWEDEWRIFEVTETRYRNES